MSATLLQRRQMPPMEHLTAREREVLNLVAQGKSSKEIAFDLGISFKTATCHRSRILNKLAAHNTAELLRAALQGGLIDIPRSGRNGDGLPDPLGRNIERVMEENRQFRQALREALDESGVLRSQLRGARKELRSASAELASLCETILQTARIRPN
ncbi:MAG: hypothetical protein C5B51_02595 [Terriglobia bacterium]|nr:MAG: hypothetical protein C5B51_02595 [Terriglobia bacterium]